MQIYGVAIEDIYCGDAVAIEIDETNGSTKVKPVKLDDFN